jgi:SAM-dependent methyltransferase
MVDLINARASPAEQERIADLFRWLPSGGRVLDIGTRDGYLALRLAERFDEVVALDLERPAILGDRIVCVQGDVCALEFPDAYFDAVLCAEVLEHIPPALLPKACAEIARVTRGVAVIGVPFRQDLRRGRSLCAACGARNPPWGHVNAFDEASLRELFTPALRWEAHGFVGQHKARTNAVSVWLMDLAGNPYGNYDQDEPCIACGARLLRPAAVGLRARLLAAVAFRLTALQNWFATAQPKWIHVRFARAPR